MAAGGGGNFNPAYETFRKHCADLLTAIQDPEVLAWELYAESVITPAVRDATNNMMHERGKRTSDLLAAVDSRIVVDPGAFDVFLSVLDKRPSMSDLCGRMKDTYSAPVLQYASYLKSVYTTKKAPIYRWPHVKCKKYINLTLIEKEDITKQEADQFTRATIRGNIDDIKKSKRATDIGPKHVPRLLTVMHVSVQRLLRCTQGTLCEYIHVCGVNICSVCRVH